MVDAHRQKGLDRMKEEESDSSVEIVDIVHNKKE